MPECSMRASRSRQVGAYAVTVPDLAEHPRRQIAELTCCVESEWKPVFRQYSSISKSAQPHTLYQYQTSRSGQYSHREQHIGLVGAYRRSVPDIA
eukprot:3769658-Rhodomonas_salina.1